MKQTLWTRNFTLITVATILGAVGGVAVNFAMSFLVFDETGSTLAAGLMLAIRLIPSTLLPLVISPLLDRCPRKPVLVATDAIGGMLYLVMGFCFWRFDFSYIGYLGFSLVLSCMGAFDALSYNSLYPKLIPQGLSQKGYSVSSMIYPTVTVLMTPLAGLLYDTFGIALLCMLQGCLAIAAAITESHIRLTEHGSVANIKGFSFRVWKQDIRDALAFLRQEKGLQSIYSYMSVTNAVSQGNQPIIVAFFRTTPGFNTVMYSAFTVAEFLGRTLGGLFHYHVKIPPKRRFSFAFLVYVVYETMDMLLLWIGYPFMLLNRGICGFLGINSASLREASVQNHIPEDMRAKLSAFFSMLCAAAAAAMSLVVGLLGEVLDYRLCLTLSAGSSLLLLSFTIWRNRQAVAEIYNHDY